MTTTKTTLALCCLPALLLSLACSSSKDDKSNTGATTEKYLGIEMPTDGFMVKNTGRTIAAGDDAEYCEVSEIPGKPTDTYYVNRLEFGNGDHSHHLIVNAALPGGAAEAKLATMKIGDQVPCLSSQGAFGDGFEFMGGIQRPYGDMSFPAGVGRVYHGGQRIVFDFHYYNTSDKDVEARSAVAFHLTDEANVKHIAQVIGFNNFTIDTPPGQQAKFTGECTFSQDMLVSSITRHTHRWGTDYSVWWQGGADDQQLIWTSHNFEEDTYHPFDAPRLMKKGEGFKFECDYDNTETHALTFGPNATDEMCILFSIGWEANDGEAYTKQDCNITQIGSDGIGHVVDISTFPKPTAEQVQSCKDNSASLSSGCSDCACNTCAAVIDQCVSDADCSPILDCVRQTGCQQADCAGACADVINQHSPGTGKLIQIASCLGAACPSVCSGAPAGADAGAN
ncbi:MAG TPA: hypothetical protein VHE30_02400 [Polyangiaceae bacterium]|nr:hypothetical protein [Polyangiaceae bacterium]